MAHNPSGRYTSPSQLQALATEAARIAALPGPKRTSAITWFVLAAETNGMSRRDAEKIIRDALTWANR